MECDYKNENSTTTNSLHEKSIGQEAPVWTKHDETDWLQVDREMK